jgi:hypothetical protein
VSRNGATTMIDDGVLMKLDIRATGCNAKQPQKAMKIF